MDRAHVPAREFGEVCLVPFEVAVRSAQVMAVMNAYAEVDGIPCASWSWLLTDLLRNIWGFEGVVVSDYESIKELCDYHRICADWAEAGRIALEAGVDVELPETQSFGGAFVDGLERGEIEMAVVDRAVARVLALKFRLGLFENPYADEALIVSAFDTPEDRSLAREIAARCDPTLKLKFLATGLRQTSGGEG